MTRISLIAAATLAAAGAASAQSLPSLAEVASSFEARGFVVTEIEREDDGMFEVEASGPDGVRIKADVNGVTGEVVRERRDD